MRLLSFACIALATIVFFHTSTVTCLEPTNIAHVTFGSCNRQDDDQSYWTRVIESAVSRDVNNPHGAQTDLFIWAGNAVYADLDESGIELTHPRATSDIQKEYNTLMENAHYKHFATQVAKQVDGVWDDHDLGLRMAGRTYPQTQSVKEIYLQLINASPEMRRSMQDQHGLYHLTTIPTIDGTDIATAYANSVCAIMLDVRSDRGPFPKFQEALLSPFSASNDKHPKSTGEVDNSDILGDAQWKWLDSIIASYVSSTATVSLDDKRAPCALTLLVSPLQVFLNDNKPFAGWDLYPAARTRLLTMLKKHEAARFLFLSGHAELAEFGIVRAHGGGSVSTGSSSSLAQRAAALLPRPALLELTSSGLTHSIGGLPRVLRKLFDWTVPAEAESGNAHIRVERRVHTARSFGTVQLLAHAEEKSKIVVRMTLRSTVDGAVLTEVEKNLEEMPTFAAETGTAEAGDVSFNDIPPFAVYDSPSEYPWLKRKFLSLQCAEVPCVPGRLYMIYRVIKWLAVSGCVLACLIVIAFLVLRELERREQLKEKMD